MHQQWLYPRMRSARSPVALNQHATGASIVQRCVMKSVDLRLNKTNIARIVGAAVAGNECGFRPADAWVEQVTRHSTFRPH